jgi:REP element-mobilizing transposase RayT
MIDEGGRLARRNGAAGSDGGETLLREHRGWYTPRKLPHFDAAGLTQAVTFRLADSLPAGIIEARRGEGAGAYRRRIEAALDAGRGSCMLRDPKNAEIVETALRHGAGRYYDLHAYVIMPNHVHALITQHEAARLADIVHRWKGWSAKLINRLTGRSGQFWQRDYFDRFIRDEEHFHAVFAYIEQNPVVAGLVTAAADWRFGSAWRRDEA